LSERSARSSNGFPFAGGLTVRNGARSTHDRRKSDALTPAAIITACGRRGAKSRNPLPLHQFLDQAPRPAALARFMLLSPFHQGEHVDHFTNETATWIEDQFDQGPAIELELGSLIAAASDWTEDESEMDDLLSGLIESGQIALSIG
jgi:hypothetical protein